MDKPRRLLDPYERQEQYEQDYKKGYSDRMVGAPPENVNDSIGWQDGWDQAKKDGF